MKDAVSPELRHQGGFCARGILPSQTQREQQAGDELLYPRAINACAARPLAAFAPAPRRHTRLIGIEVGFQ